MRYLPFSFPVLFVFLFACQSDIKKPEVVSNSGFPIAGTTLSDNPPPLAGSIADTAAADWYLKNSLLLIDAGQPASALDMAQKAAGIFEKWLGENDVNVADARLRAGVCFLILSNCNITLRDSAMVYHQKALATYLALFGEMSSKVADAYDGIGTILSSAGQMDAGLAHYQKALDIRDSISDENYLSLGKTYSNIGRYYDAKGQYLEAIHYYETALKMVSQQPENDRFATVPMIINIGVSHTRLGLYSEGMKHFQTAMEITLSERGTNHFRMTEIYSNIGANYYFQGKFDKAISMLDKAIEIETQIFNSKNCSKLAAPLTTQGAIYSSTGQYQKAIEFFQKALDLKIGHVGNNALELTELHYNIANGWLYLKQYESSEQHYNKAIQIFNDNNASSHPNTARIYNSLGILNEQMGNDSAALAYFQKAIDLQNNLKQHPATIASTSLGIGRMYVKRKSFGDAEKIYQEAYQVFKQTYGEGHFWTIKALGHLSLLEIARHDLKSALQYNDKVMQGLNYHPQGSLDDATSLKDLIEFLAIRAWIERLLYQQTDALEHLKNVVQISETALQALDELKGRYVESASKQDLIAASYSLFEGAVAARCTLADRTRNKQFQHDAFLYFEQSKAFLMRESMHELETRNNLKLPETLFDREQELKYLIAKKEQERYQKLQGEKSKEAKDSIFTHCTAQIFDLKHSYDSVRQTFATRYPEYHRLRYDNNVLGLKQVQQTLLTPRQALLEYFVGDSSIFIFAIRPDAFRVEEVKKDFPLKDWVADMRAGLVGPHRGGSNMNEQEGIKKYAEAAHNIYTKIFQPLEDFLAGQEKLIIVPDGELGYVPFDALLTAMPDNLEEQRFFPYLLQKHQISISYSATLLREMQQKQHERPPAKSFLGVAPHFPGIENLADRQTHIGALPRLFYNMEEVEKIHSFFGGDTLVGSAATKQAFLKVADKYRILNLATHAKANDQVGDYSYLAFYELDDSEENVLLFNRELYNLRLNADLVVLSACETGIGELRRGEGIISLARGFAYAGAKSMVTTLWEVNDQRSSELMQLFYQNLRKGMEKDSALCLAKRDFLQTPSVSPYYWAAFVPIGDMAPVPSDSGNPWMWGLVLAAIFTSMLLWWLRRRKAI